MSRFVWTFKILLSHWRLHPMQLAMLIIGLICATALWSGVQALNQQARVSYDRAAAMFGGARTPSLLGKDGSTFPQQLFVDLRRQGWAVSPILENRIQIGSRSVRLVGIEPITLPKETGTASDMSSKNLRDFLLPPYQTLVSPETLQELGLKAGDRPQLKNGKLLPPLALNVTLAPGLMMVDIGVAQQVLNMPDRISRLLVSPKPSGPVSPLQSVVGDQLELMPPESESGLEHLTDSFHLNLTAFGFLAFAVGIFIVNSAIGLTFEQRLPMFRTMRACGVSLFALNVSLCGELIIFALCAGFIGLLGGYFIAAALLPDVSASLRGLYGAEIPGQLTLRPAWWIAGFAMSVAGTITAAVQSLVKLNRLSLLASAQPDAWRRTQQTWLKWQGSLAAMFFLGGAVALWLGASLAAGFAVLAGLLSSAALGLPGLLSLFLSAGEGLAGRYRPRHPLVKWFWADSRQQLSGLSLALMALLLAIAVNVGVGTMVGSFRETFSGWLEGRLASEVYLDASNDEQAVQIKDWLRQQPEVTAILPGGRAETNFGIEPLEVLGLADHATYRNQWPLLEATPAAWDALQTGDAAFVSEQFARRSKIKLNDNVHIQTPTGDWPLKIAGLYADYGNPKGQITVAFHALIKRFPQTPQTRLGLRVSLSDVPNLIKSLQQNFALSDRQVADQTTVKIESKRIFDRTFAVTAALNAFTLGVAAIALLTNLLTLSNARLPGLAPLWAMGVTLPRLASVELLKTMMMALITALLAIPLGLAVGWCLLAIVNVRAFGWQLPLHLAPLQLIQVLGLSMLAALFATVIPLIKLFRMPSARLIKIFSQER